MGYDILGNRSEFFTREQILEKLKKKYSQCEDVMCVYANNLKRLYISVSDNFFLVIEDSRERANVILCESLDRKGFDDSIICSGTFCGDYIYIVNLSKKTVFTLARNCVSITDIEKLQRKIL